MIQHRIDDIFIFLKLFLSGSIQQLLELLFWSLYCLKSCHTTLARKWFGCNGNTIRKNPRDGYKLFAQPRHLRTLANHKRFWQWLSCSQDTITASEYHVAWHARNKSSLHKSLESEIEIGSLFPGPLRSFLQISQCSKRKNSGQINSCLSLIELVMFKTLL